ncbi:MAG TPA: DUF6644 family protein [Bryobacteraceae bacterium]
MSFSAIFPGSIPFFRWCDSTWLCNAIKGTTWVFPLTETIHILALVVLLGSIMLLDFRLLGLGIRNWTPWRIANELRKFIGWALVVILVTGWLLFMAEPMKAYDNMAFLPKMLFLFSAILFHYTVFQKASSIDKLYTPILAKCAALVSLFLWFGIGVMGRAIGFV